MRAGVDTLGRDGNYILDVENQICESPAVADESAAGAPEHEIEVTLEMVLEGRLNISLLNEDFVDIDEGLAMIFRAMFCASPAYRLEYTETIRLFGRKDISDAV
jgi:hypothetical protein